MEQRTHNRKQITKNTQHSKCSPFNVSSSMSGGFTLVEMIVALFIFSVVMVVTTGALISIIEANRKAQAVEAVMNNLSFSLDSMTRALRVGIDYNPGPGSSCSGGGVSSISFIDTDGQDVTYRLSGGRLERSIAGVAGGAFIEMTAPEVTIKTFCMYVQGQSPSDSVQPRILVLVGGEAGAGRSLTSFNIQTLVSQRILDR